MLESRVFSYCFYCQQGPLEWIGVDVRVVIRVIIALDEKLRKNLNDSGIRDTREKVGFF